MEDRANVLRSMQICRICLDEKGPFTNIYSSNETFTIPLQLQLTACLALEAYESDGFPQLICETCKAHTIKAYDFKVVAKKSNDALKIFLATGKLNKSVTVNEQQPTMIKPASPQVNMIDKEPLPEEPPTETIQDQVQNIFEDEQETVTLNFAKELPVQAQQDSSVDEITITPVEEMEQDPVRHITTDVFPCTHCERTFPLKQLLELHLKNHYRERTFKCDECDRKFFTKYDLGKHIQTHVDSKPFTCIICNKTFAAENLLHRHEKIHVDVPKYICPDEECDRTFLTRTDLDQHVEKHNKKRPYTCSICDKKFVFKQGLQRHEAIHNDDKPHKCNYCEASFSSPIKLMRHITSHAGLRPYPCKLCGRTFLLSHHLTRHMRGHYANKSQDMQPIGQYKCDVCSMSFRRKDSLINHSAIHSMVNLKCVICNTEFANAKAVKEHITTHLSGLPYPCDKCDYSFESQDQLEEHELKHAAMEYEEQIEQEIKNQEFQEEYDMDDGDEDDGNITEFTITTDAEDNPQIVRRPRNKNKNYAQFLKDELGSDVEYEVVEDDDALAAVLQEDSSQEVSFDPIKPIVRSEGTKMYSRKSFNKKHPAFKEIKQEVSDVCLESLGLTQEFVKDLPTEQYIDMKLGDVIYKVKKVTMKKTEFDAVAKQDNVEMKGGILVKKSIKTGEMLSKRSNVSSSSTSFENILNLNRDSTPVKHLITKTYMKRSSNAQLNNPSVSDTDIPQPKTQILQSISFN